MRQTKVTELSLDSVLWDGLLVDRKWLKDKGFNRPAVDYYLRSEKLEAVARGVYRKSGPPLKWQSVVYSLSELGYPIHVGHMTALAYHGFQHFLALGDGAEICLYSEKNLPAWIHAELVKHVFLDMPRNPFAGSQTGIVEVPFGTWDWPISYSTPERAFLELLGTLSNADQIQSAKILFEGAANFRPALIQTLLEECRQVKAKRLFLWLAREQKHVWYGHIDRSKIDLGTGKRQIAKGGMLDEEYLITVPRENKYGQWE
jgi:hypothetical protein